MKGLKISIFLIILSIQLFAKTDSIGIEIVDKQTFVLHKVEKGEGLYGIARKYKCTLEEIQKSNQLESNTLELGQLLKVPVKYKAVKMESKKVKASEKPSKQVNSKTHIVKKGETLSIISRKYGISINEIMKLNGLKAQNLSIGQKILINSNLNTNNSTENKNSKDVAEVLEDSKATEGKNKNTAATTQTRPNTYLNSIDYNESGVAGFINDKTINPKKSIALHKTAPIGTIIRVTNSLNNKSIYVKVIGVLPETGDNENTIIVLSNAAANLLEAKDAKFRVQLNYSIAK